MVIDVTKASRETLERAGRALLNLRKTAMLSGELDEASAQLHAEVCTAPKLRSMADRDHELWDFMVNNFDRDDIDSTFNIPTANMIWKLMTERVLESAGAEPTAECPTCHGKHPEVCSDAAHAEEPAELDLARVSNTDLYREIARRASTDDIAAAWIEAIREADPDAHLSAAGKATKALERDGLTDEACSCEEAEGLKARVAELEQQLSSENNLHSATKNNRDYWRNLATTWLERLAKIREVMGDRE